MKVLAGAVWGASTKDISNSHLSVYRDMLNAESNPFYNPSEIEIKESLVSSIMESFTKRDFSKEDLLTMPWNESIINLPRAVASLIAFTNDHGNESTPEFFPVDEILVFLQKIRKQYEDTGKKLTVPDQFNIALSIVNNNPVAAGILAHSAYRAIARVWDTRMSSKLSFPVNSDRGEISMISITESTADFKSFENVVDPLGNTYHFWSQFTAGLIFTLQKRQKLIEIGLYDIAFAHAPELTYLIRHGIRGKTQKFGYHKEVDRQGLHIGRAIGNVLTNNISDKSEIIKRNKGKFIQYNRQRGIKERVISKLMTSPENIAFSVYPIAEAIYEISPDYILVLDRGGRIIGYATYQLYNELFGRLPTYDHAMHYQKISRRLSDETINERLEPIANYVMNLSASPKVFIIDDWMNTGLTRRKINLAFSRFSGNKIEVYYGVLRGRGKNVTGDRLSLTYCTWHGKERLIGVESSRETGEIKSAHSKDAIEYRRRMAGNIRNFAQKIKE